MAQYHWRIDERGGLSESTGEPSEAGLYADGLAAYQHLIEERQIAADSVVFYGSGTGAGVSYELATRVEIGGLVADWPFVSVDQMIEDWDSVWVSIDNQTTADFDNLLKAGKIKQPLLIFAYPDDKCGFAEKHARMLFEASPASHETMVQIIEVSGDAFKAEPDLFLSSMREFLSSLSGDK